MSHNIKNRDVQVGNEMAWHKLTVIEPNITSENCRIRYDMSIEPIYFRNPAGDYAEANGRQIVASDDGLPVGKVVGKDYKLISNSEVWDSVQNGLGGTKHKIVSCGTVDNRALGFVSIKIAEDFRAANRDTQAVMNVLWGHGGNKAVIARTGLTVIVCQNTFNIAMAERADFRLSIRHTSKANVLDLGKAIDAHIGVTAEFQKAMNELHSVDATPTTARKVYTGFLCNEEVPETKTGISRLSNTVDDMVSLFQHGKGNTGRNLADVFNGATDYYSHESSGGRANAWKQFNSSEFGSGDKRKSEFFEMLTNPDALRSTMKQGEQVLLALGI